MPFHLQECFADPGYSKGRASSLALRIYPELTEAQQAAVVDEMAGALGR